MAGALLSVTSDGIVTIWFSKMLIFRCVCRIHIFTHWSNWLKLHNIFWIDRWIQLHNLKIDCQLTCYHSKHYMRTNEYVKGSIQVTSVAQSCPTLCDPMNRSTPGFPVHHQLPEFTQTHVHQVGDAIQPSHPLSSPSPPAPNPSQRQGLFQWVNSLHVVGKVLEFQLQHLSFQWTPRTDLL